jgi:hypothetical protein
MEENLRVVWFRIALEIQVIEWGVKRGEFVPYAERMRLTVIYN